MNTDTGQVYRTPEQIKAALERGEPLAEVSENVADAVELGREALNRAERRLRAREARREAKRRKKGAP